jgi:hypothetical protein
MKSNPVVPQTPTLSDDPFRASTTATATQGHAARNPIAPSSEKYQNRRHHTVSSTCSAMVLLGGDILTKASAAAAPPAVSAPSAFAVFLKAR